MGIDPDRDGNGRFVTGSYHTDGRRLLRIVSEAANGGLRAVEDCRTLDLMLIPVDELDSLGLQPVAAESPRSDGQLMAGSTA